MKKLWNLLCVICIIFCIILSSFLFSLKENYDSIYFNNNTKVFFVNDINSKYSNQELINNLEKFSNENKINIYRQFFNTNDLSQYNRDIYVNVVDSEQFFKDFNVKNKENIDLKNINLTINDLDFFNTENKISIKNLKESNYEDIFGYYYFATQNTLLVEQFLNDNGFDYTRIDGLPYSEILEHLEDQALFIPLIVSITIFLITFIYVSLYEVFLRFKEISVYEMLGYKKLKVVYILFLEKLRLIVFLLIFSLLLTTIFDFIFKSGSRFLEFLFFTFIITLIYLILVILVYLSSLVFVFLVNIKDMLKGKKNTKFIKPLNYFSIFSFTIILVLLLTNLVIERKSVKDELKYVSNYIQLKDYITTRISITNDLNEDLENKLLNFTAKNYEDIILFYPNNFFTNNYKYLKNHNQSQILPIISVNENYAVKFNNLVKAEEIKQGKNILNILVPSSISKEHLEKVKKEKSHYLKNKDDVVINVINYNDKDIFIFSTFLNAYRFRFYSNPYFVVYTKENIINGFDKNKNTLMSMYSNLNMYINLGEENNYKKLYPKLLEAGLEKNIRNVRNVYKNINNSIKKLENKIYIQMLSFVIMFLIYVLMIIFMSITYLEDKKKSLAIKYLLGYKFFNRHLEYILINIILMCFSAIFIMFVFKYYNVYLFFIIFVEFLIVLIVLKKYENDNLLEVIKNS